jgi:uncharacterized protein (DUF362 family)
MAFFQCPKCKNKWQYNISKCPDCFLELERIRSTKIKVIGISDVKIPSVLHPKTPYFVLALEDEKGSRWVQKSIKEYKIGEEFRSISTQNKQAVSIWKVKYDTLEAVESTIELIGGIKINENSKILILPALTAVKHPHLAQNTSPEFLEGIIKFLKQKGITTKNIQMASQSFDDVPIEALAQKSQLLQTALKHKINVLDLAQTKFIEKNTDSFTVQVSEQVLKNDLIINLPIFKLDLKTKIKGATDNILKLLSKKSYLSFEKIEDYQNILKEINQVLPEYLNLAEAISIQRTDKIVTYLGLVLAGFNSLNLDRVFAEIVMTENLPEYLKNIKIENIPIIGRRLDELKYNIEKIY